MTVHCEIKFQLDFEISSKFLLEITHFFSHREGCCLLYSGGGFDTARSSFLFLFPQKKIALYPPYASNPWDLLEKECETFSEKQENIPLWIGYLSYELGCFSDCDLTISHHFSSLPQALFYKAALILKVDHHTKQSTVMLYPESPLLNEDDRTWLKKLANDQGWKDLQSQMVSLNVPTFHSAIIHCSDTRKSYSQKIQSIKEEIAKGNVYQLNLSQEWKIHTQGLNDSFDLFAKIIQENPTPFMAFLQAKEFSIVSSSPERFLKKEGNALETSPIKGTMPRGKNAEEDWLNKSFLLASEKENAELLMITDLLRNDLGKISQPGTVETIKLCHCETYANVFHLYSQIHSQAKNLSSLALLRDVFPGGSITGCPKLSAMNIIYQLEARARGVYTGSMGYLTSGGDFDFNIAIRTLIVFPNSHIQLQLGGGIVIDSDPEKEYEETLHKGETLFKVLGINGVQNKG